MNFLGHHIDCEFHHEQVPQECTCQMLNQRRSEMTNVGQEINLNELLHEPDAMKWAIAWRETRDRNVIDANGSADSGIDGWMVAWFANAMAAGEMKATGGRFVSGDGLADMIEGGEDCPSTDHG
jgi:hypothetical protein